MSIKAHIPEVIKAPKVYSLAEIAGYVGVDRRVLRNELSDKNGDLEFKKIGGQYKILGEHVLKYLGSATVNQQSSQQVVDTGGAAVVKE